MSNYLRDRTPGSTWFFTVVTAGRSPWLASTHAIVALRNALGRVRLRLPLRVDAAVVLPDHLHMIWTLPPGDAAFGKRWSMVKRYAGDEMLAFRGVAPGAVAAGARRERDLWQRRFWEHRIRDDSDLATHCDYIHYNPVRHGLVERAMDWPHSSLRRFVEKGWLPADWGSSPPAATVRGE